MDATAIQSQEWDHFIAGFGSSGDVKRFIRTYLLESRRLVEELGAAIDAGDLAQVRHAVHTLRPTSAMLGAKALSDLCGRLETIARTGPLGREGREVGRAILELFPAVADELGAKL